MSQISQIGDQTLAQDTATNGTTAVYTVPAGKKFFLVAALLGTNNGAVGSVVAQIRNDSAVVQMEIGKIQVGATAQNSPAVPFNPQFPVEIPESWDIAVVSDVASLEGSLGVFGYEADA